MAKTTVNEHHRRGRDDTVVPVRKHLREVAEGKGVAGGAVKGPDASTLTDVQEMDFEALSARINIIPGAGRLDTAQVLKKRMSDDSVEIVHVTVQLEGQNERGYPNSDGASFINTGEPLGRDTAYAFLEESLRRQYGPDVEFRHDLQTYQRWVRGQIGGHKFDTSYLPEWLKEDEPRVPAEDVLAAADYFANQTKGTPLHGKTVALSGKFSDDTSRDDATMFLETLGATVAGGVSKKVDVLIADPESNSNNVKKAKALGIPVVHPDEVMQYPEDNLTAWRTELYRRHRLGTRYTLGEKYQSGPEYDRVTEKKPSLHLAKSHEEALLCAEKGITCVHLWSAAKKIDTRDRVLRTGTVLSVRECQRCGKQDTKVISRHNWSGD